jgi:hypothetical protein
MYSICSSSFITRMLQWIRFRLPEQQLLFCTSLSKHQALICYYTWKSRLDKPTYFPRDFCLGIAELYIIYGWLDWQSSCFTYLPNTARNQESNTHRRTTKVVFEPWTKNFAYISRNPPNNPKIFLHKLCPSPVEGRAGECMTVFWFFQLITNNRITIARKYIQKQIPNNKSNKIHELRTLVIKVVWYGVYQNARNLQIQVIAWVGESDNGRAVCTHARALARSLAPFRSNRKNRIFF